MTTLNFLFTDADLIASFNESQCGRRQYEVYFLGECNAHMMVWADNKREANKIAREYARRILNRKFESITIGD